MNKVDVAIVGGGAAGIGAGRRLAGSGLSAVILEAGDRLGGRAHTVRTQGLALDLGCGWLHSARRNPWVAIAGGQGFAVDRTQARWRDQWRQLGFSKAEQAAAFAAFGDFAERMEGAAPSSDRAIELIERGNPWNSYIEALSGYMNGVEIAGLSVADYLAYDAAAGEENWRVRAGYGALVAASAREAVVSLGTAVSAIDHSGLGITLETARGTVTAGAAIVTCSTDVLASGAIRFGPAAADHLHAAACLPLGLADKLFLHIDGEVETLEANAHLIGDPHRATTGSYTLRPLGQPVIECFFGGAGARALERAGPGATTDFAIRELCALLGSAWADRLRPVAVSAWGRDRLFQGSYSHARPGEAAQRQVLARPIDERLWFAGEATNPQDFSTAHGAYATGAAAADAIVAMVRPGASSRGVAGGASMLR